MRTSRQVPKSPSGRRMAIAYTLLAALALAVVLAVLQAGAQRRPARQVPAGQRVAQATLCLGPAGTELRLEQSGRFLTLDGPDRLAGRLRLDGDRLHGQVACRDGGSAALDVVLDGGGLRGTVGGAELAHDRTERIEAAPHRAPPGRGDRELTGRDALDAAEQRLME